MGPLTPSARPDLAETFLPPLQNGDRLTLDEFERRYNAMPEHVWAELVEGVVVMSSPVQQVRSKPRMTRDNSGSYRSSLVPGVSSR